MLKLNLITLQAQHIVVNHFVCNYCKNYLVLDKFLFKKNRYYQVNNISNENMG